jgi:hypothetical protein
MKGEWGNWALAIDGLCRVGMHIEQESSDGQMARCTLWQRCMVHGAWASTSRMSVRGDGEDVADALLDGPLGG